MEEESKRDFDRILRNDTIGALRALSDGHNRNWWKDLLDRWVPSGQQDNARMGLRLAIRNDYLNFYHLGQSIARVGVARSTARFDIHGKYVCGSSINRYARFCGNRALNASRSAELLGALYSPEALDDWIEKSTKYAGKEKPGVEWIVARNADVIDLEVAIPKHQNGGLPGASRVDLVALERTPSVVRVVFWEAKRLSDKRLRKQNGDPEVLLQIEAYKSFLEGNSGALKSAYKRVCDHLVELNGMVRPGRPLSPLIEDVSSGRVGLEIDPTPRLVVFSDADVTKRTIESHLRHMDKLKKNGVRVLDGELNASRIHLGHDDCRSIPSYTPSNRS